MVDMNGGMLRPLNKHLLNNIPVCVPVNDVQISNQDLFAD